MVSVMTSVDIIRTHLSTKKMLEQDEHGVTLLLCYLHVKCALHLSRILAGEGMTITRNIAYVLVNNMNVALCGCHTVGRAEGDLTFSCRGMEQWQNAVGRHCTRVQSTVMFRTWSNGKSQSGGVKENFHLHICNHWIDNKHRK